MGSPLAIACTTVIALFAGAGLMRFKRWWFNRPTEGWERVSVYLGVGFGAPILAVYGPAHADLWPMLSVWAPAGLIAALLDRLRRFIPEDDGPPAI